MAAAIFTHPAHQPAPSQALTGRAVAPMDSSSGNGSGSNDSGSSATISANDFLTLLVTEMQNQDPTAQTDPNEYVNQLVQVNSLEQLISINQTLTGALDPPSSSSQANKDAAAGKMAATPSTQAAAANHNVTAFAATPHTPGNLSVPAASPAAQRVAHALDGNGRSGSVASRIAKHL